MSFPSVWYSHVSSQSQNVRASLCYQEAFLASSLISESINRGGGEDMMQYKKVDKEIGSTSAHLPRKQSLNFIEFSLSNAEEHEQFL